MTKELYIKSLLILFFFSIQVIAASKSTRSDSAYSDFIKFMEDNNFSSGGPSINTGITCTTNLPEETRTVCNTREILNSYRANFPEDQEYINFPDGTILKNHFFTGESQFPDNTRDTMKVLSLMEKSPGRQSHTAIEIFEKIRSLFITEITNNTQQENLTSDQQLLINRVNNVRITISQEQCQTGVWASFSKLNFEITACSAILKLPEHAMIPLLAHEMGHSMDFCGMTTACLGHSNANSQTPSITELNNLAAKFRADNPGITDPEVQRQLDSYKESYTEALRSEGFADESALLPRDRGNYNFRAFRDNLEELKNNGTFKVIDQGIPIARNPLVPIQTCLEENFHQEKIPSDFNKMCEDSTFSERGAQIWSTKITSKYVIERPPISDNQKLALMEVSLASIQGKNANSWKGKEEDFNILFLSSKELQEVYNCNPLPTQTLCLN